MNPSDLIIPLLLAGAAACGTGRRVNVYAALTRGAEDGLTVLLHVIPALVGLLTAVSMFRASRAADAGPPRIRQRRTGRRQRSDGLPRARQLHRPGGRRHAGQHRNHLLHHRRLLRLRRHRPYPPHRPGGAGGRPHWLSHRCPHRAAPVWPLTFANSRKKARQSRAFSFPLCRFSHLSFKCARRRSRFPRMSVTYVSPPADSSGDTLWQVWNMAVSAPAASAMASATR